MPDIALRPATVEDVDFLFTLHRASLGPYVDQIWGWDDDEQRAYLHRTLDLDCARIIVVDGVDGGRLDTEERYDELYLALIELLPHHQSRGIGGQLIRQLVDHSFADGRRVSLNVLGVNHRAYRLYQQMGFAEESREGVAPKVRIRMVTQPPRDFTS